MPSSRRRRPIVHHILALASPIVHKSSDALHSTLPSNLAPRVATRRRLTHEVKFEGWRMQLHKGGHTIHVFSKNAYEVLEQEMSE
jgi:ATP-dependent DNA ligase